MKRILGSGRTSSSTTIPANRSRASATPMALLGCCRKQAVGSRRSITERAAIGFAASAPPSRAKKALGDKIDADQRLELRQVGLNPAQAVRRRPGAARSDLSHRPLEQRTGLSRSRSCIRSAASSRSRQLCQGGVAANRRLRRYRKSRAEARLLKERGRGVGFRLLSRGVDQPTKIVRIWVVDQWSKIGLHTRRCCRPGRGSRRCSDNFDVSTEDVARTSSIRSPMSANTAVRCQLHGQFRSKKIDMYNRQLQNSTRPSSGPICQLKYVLDEQAISPAVVAACRAAPLLSKAGRSGRAITSIRIWRRSGSTNGARRRVNQISNCRGAPERGVVRCAGSGQNARAVVPEFYDPG